MVPLHLRQSKELLNCINPNKKQPVPLISLLILEERTALPSYLQAAWHKLQNFYSWEQPLEII